MDASHSDAMFGGGGISIIPTPVPSGKSVLSDVNELFGPIVSTLKTYVQESEFSLLNLLHLLNINVIKYYYFI